jgi:hypothetical protein
MNGFSGKRFVKGILILGIISIAVGIGRGVYDSILLLNHPRNVYDARFIEIPIGLSNLSNASYQTTLGHTNLLRYELSNGEIGGGNLFLLDEEEQEIIENLSSPVGHTLKSLQFGVQRLPVSKISFRLDSESSANVQVYLVNDYDFILGTPNADQAVIYEFSPTSDVFTIEIPRLYAPNNVNQWTYASFYSVLIVLEDGRSFTMRDMQLSIASQRLLEDDTTLLIH